jgi:Caspase domain
MAGRTGLAVSQHDRAVVIGISRYADARADPPWISDLNGPDNDAADVARWLRRGDGGGLPNDNVRVIRSADFADPANIGPQQQAVVDEFTALRNLPTTTYNGQYAGRRLYVYVSGHGMAARRQDAAVITAEAKRAEPLHVLITSWVDWLWYGARFAEYVLWVDTCATRQPVGLLKPCPWPLEFRPDMGAGQLFVAFAAEFGKTAVEAQLDGQWHGVFTYALLKGLDGANGSPVRTSNLRDYLLNSPSTFMTEEQRNDSRVAKEPAFGTTDELLFAAPPQPRFPVTLQFPEEAVGKQATISFGASSPLVADTVLQQREWAMELDAGSYVAYVPELDRSQPFTVTGGGSDDVVAVL